MSGYYIVPSPSITLVLIHVSSHLWSAGSSKRFSSKKQALQSNICCFHPILVTWVLVVFGNEATKMNSLFIFYFVLPVLPGKQKTEITQLKVMKLPKTKLPKYVMSRTQVNKKIASKPRTSLIAPSKFLCVQKNRCGSF